MKKLFYVTATVASLMVIFLGGFVIKCHMDNMASMKQSSESWNRMVEQGPKPLVMHKKQDQEKPDQGSTRTHVSPLDWGK